MHEIVSALIDRDTDSVRALLRKAPELKEFRSEAGHSIYELAEKSGCYLVLACVYRETQSQIQDSETILYGILASLSYDYFCAGYASGIEYLVWHCLENDGVWPPELEDNYYPIEAETITDIKYVVEQTGCWYENEVGVLPVDKWLKEYRR